MSPGLGIFALSLVGTMLVAAGVGLLLGRVAPRSARLAGAVDGLVLTIPVLGVLLLAVLLVPSPLSRWVAVAIVVAWAVPPIWRAAATANTLTGVRARAAVAFELPAGERRELNRARWLPLLRRGLAEAGRRVLAGLALAGVVGLPGLGRDLVTSVTHNDYPGALVAAIWLTVAAVALEVLWLTLRTKETT